MLTSECGQNILFIIEFVTFNVRKERSYITTVSRIFWITILFFSSKSVQDAISSKIDMKLWSSVPESTWPSEVPPCELPPPPPPCQKIGVSETLKRHSQDIERTFGHADRPERNWKAFPGMEREAVKIENGFSCHDVRSGIFHWRSWIARFSLFGNERFLSTVGPLNYISGPLF